MSPGFEEGQGDITGHIPLGMSRCVPCPDNPDMDGYEPDFESNFGLDEHDLGRMEKEGLDGR